MLFEANIGILLPWGVPGRALGSSARPGSAPKRESIGPAIKTQERYASTLIFAGDEK